MQVNKPVNQRANAIETKARDDDVLGRSDLILVNRKPKLTGNQRLQGALCSTRAEIAYGADLKKRSYAEAETLCRKYH